MTATATQFGIWSNRGGAAPNQNNNQFLGGPLNADNSTHGNADSRFLLPRWMLTGRPETSRSWLETGGPHFDWLTQFNRTPTVALNTADGNSFGSDTTPTLEFTGSD